MRFQEIINAVVFVSSLAGVTTAQQRSGNRQNQGQATSSAASAGETCLNAANVQSASNSDGQANQEAGQSPSIADPANFINFCTGKTTTNGLQQKQGSCNGVVMGDIPAQSNMVSTMILFPAPGSDSNIAAGQAFDVKVKVNNLVTGSFTNPTDTYYAAPQTLQGGKIVGHTHVTIQNMGGSLTPDAPLDATTFAFFKGINDDGNGQGLLTAPVAKGLPAGNYRICTLSSASNHQPVLMPVAQRGAQDDCTKFTVGGTGAGNGNGGGGGGQNGGQAGNAGAGQTGQNAGNAGGDQAGQDGGGATANADAAQTSQQARRGRQGGRGGASAQAAGASATAATAATSAAARQGGRGQQGAQGGAGQQASGAAAAAATSPAAAQAGGAGGGAGGAAATQAASSPARQAGQRTQSAKAAQGTGTGAGTGGNTQAQQGGGRRGGFGGFGQGRQGLRLGKARRFAMREFAA